MSIYGVSGGRTAAYKKVYVIENGKTKKMGKGYIIENGKAKKIYSSGPFGGYTGNYTTSQITKNGVLYTLYTMTGSGTLTLNGSAEYWMCGSGAGGENGTKNSQSGNGGGGGYVKSGTLSAGTHVVTIGAGSAKNTNGNTTSVGTNSVEGGKYTGNGGSGGGNGYKKSSSDIDDKTAGVGAGVTTIPFDITSLYAHCAGGGGGIYYSSDEGGANRAGAGGSNGSNGEQKYETGLVAQAAGGTKGGGAGGTGTGNFSFTSSSLKGGNATFYGSAGGGAGATNSLVGSGGGTGYQGVLYLLIPAA